jgi:hypothetical protein
MTIVSSLTNTTLNFWQERSHVQLTLADAQQMISNIGGFFTILSEWDAHLATQTGSCSFMG